MLKKIYLLLLLPLFLAGCVQTETQLTINKDNSAVYQQKFFADAKLFEGDNPLLRLASDKEDKKADLERETGMKFKDYHEDGNVGSVGTKDIYDLRTDIWNTTLNDKFYKIKTKSPEGKIVDITKGFFKTDYSVDVEIMPTKGDADSSVDIIYENTMVAPTPSYEYDDDIPYDAEEASRQMRSMEEANRAILDKMKNTLNIKIPTRADSHNSQNIDTEELIYRWDLEFDTYTPVQLKFSVYNVVNIITVMIIILIIVGELFYFALYNKEH